MLAFYILWNMSRKITQDIFIKELKEKHPNLTPLTEYKGSKSDMVVRCNIHVYTFKTKPNNLMSGRGCKYCGLERSTKKRKKPINKVISDLNEVHNSKYNYPNIEEEYVNNRSYITFICPIHGKQHIKALKHLHGQGCKYCSHQSFPHTTDSFIELSNIVHGNRYKYSETAYKNQYTDVKIICPIHGEFAQKPKDHLSGCGCPKCNESYLEKEIRKILENNEIEYVYEYKEHTTHNKSVDFYIPKYNIAIECQGIQHFKSIDFFGGNECFHKTVKRDILKHKELITHKDKVVYIVSDSHKEYLNNEIFENIYNKNVFLIETIIDNKKQFIEYLEN